MADLPVTSSNEEEVKQEVPVESDKIDNTTNLNKAGGIVRKPAASNILPPVPSHLMKTVPQPEVVHLHIVKIIQHNPTPGAPPFEVLDVIEGPAQPYLETVRVYPNQVLPTGQTVFEREQSIRRLKISAWNSFVESVNQTMQSTSSTSIEKTNPPESDTPTGTDQQDSSAPNLNLQSPSTASPSLSSSNDTAKQQSSQQTPFEQLYTDHNQYLQQQQQQRQQQPPGGNIGRSPSDVDYAYWHQKQASGGGDGTTLSTFPQELMDNGGQSKHPKAPGQGRPQKSLAGKGGQKVRERAKKEKGITNGSGAAVKSSTGGLFGQMTAGTGSKKRKNAGGGDDANPKKMTSTSRVKKQVRNLSKSENGKIPSANASQQEAGSRMVKVSGAGDITPSDAAWFPFPHNLDRAANLFESRKFAWDRDTIGHKAISSSIIRQMTSAMNDEAASKKKQQENSVVATESSQGIVLLPSAEAVKESASIKSKGKEKTSKDSKDIQEEWVQCDECGRWRTLPQPDDPLYPNDLPDQWTCSMNTWHPSKASCSVPEDTSSASQQAGALRAKKIRVWVRRLRSGDKYEAKHNYGKGTNNTPDSRDKDKEGSGKSGKRFGEVDWIRCSSPHCGKWRACQRGCNGIKIKNENKEWFCWMNSWDEARSSCGAPQEGTAVLSLGTFNGVGDKGDDDDDDSVVDSIDDSSSDRGVGALESAVVQGISSRGRVVRSRWNSRRSRK